MKMTNSAGSKKTVTLPRSAPSSRQHRHQPVEDAGGPTTSTPSPKATVINVFHRSPMCSYPQLFRRLTATLPQTRLPADPEGPAGNRYYVLLHCSVERQLGGNAFQAASMLFNMSSVLSPPAIHAVASFQNAPEPMAAGIMSAPSKRNMSEFFSMSAKPLMHRVGEVRGVEVLAGRQAGLATGDDRRLVVDRVGVRQARRTSRACRCRRR